MKWLKALMKMYEIYQKDAYKVKNNIIWLQEQLKQLEEK